MKIKHAHFYFSQPPYSQTPDQDQLLPALQKEYERLEDDFVGSQNALADEQENNKTLVKDLEYVRAQLKDWKTTAAQRAIDADRYLAEFNRVNAQLRDLNKVYQEAVGPTGPASYWSKRHYLLADAHAAKIADAQYHVKEALRIYRDDLADDQSELGVRLNNALDALAGKKKDAQERSADVG